MLCVSIGLLSMEELNRGQLLTHALLLKGLLCVFSCSAVIDLYHLRFLHFILLTKTAVESARRLQCLNGAVSLVSMVSYCSLTRRTEIKKTATGKQKQRLFPSCHLFPTLSLSL